MSNQISRRNFLAAGGAAALLSGVAHTELVAADVSASGIPAILGGTPLSLGSVPRWPMLEGDEDKMLMEVLNSRIWFRTENHKVATFERFFAEMNGAKHCVATNGGTSALITALSALDVGPGDEVITSPYTFVATINSIHEHFALPTVADVDIETFQVDPVKVDAACTENTTVLMPVHIGGSPADMDAFMEIGARRNLAVVEDACQAHVGKWRDKYLGAIGTAGCFSFQETKHLASGEGGAVLTNDDALAAKVYASHTNGFSRDRNTGNPNFIATRCRNNRMVEFVAAILLAQAVGVERNAELRQENGMYLNELLSEIPGIAPAKLYPGATRSAWHMYMFRIIREEFGIDRRRFVAAMRAENIRLSTGFAPIDWVEFTKETYSTKAARRVYSEKDLADWAERVGDLPMFKRLCDEALFFNQSLLLGPRRNMEIIADAIRRIQRNAGRIATT